MASRKVSRAFKDISFSFDPHPVTKDLPVLANERAIIRSVRNLVETIPTERFFNASLGSDIRGSLFEFIDVGTALVIEEQIRNTVTYYEPRIDNIEVTVTVAPDTNEMNCTVQYDIVGIPAPTQEVDVLLFPARV